jgi:hypothetical protein
MTATMIASLIPTALQIRSVPERHEQGTQQQQHSQATDHQQQKKDDGPFQALRPFFSLRVGLAIFVA